MHHSGCAAGAIPGMPFLTLHAACDATMHDNTLLMRCGVLHKQATRVSMSWQQPAAAASPTGSHPQPQQQQQQAPMTQAVAA
jgi:hypothetical protein